MKCQLGLLKNKLKRKKEGERYQGLGKCRGKRNEESGEQGGEKARGESTDMVGLKNCGGKDHHIKKPTKGKKLTYSCVIA